MKVEELNNYNLVQVDLQPSSNIAGAFYDSNKKVLMVTFRANISYMYFNIEAELIEHWKQADSVGKFFAEYIKHGKYEKIERD